MKNLNLLIYTKRYINYFLMLLISYIIIFLALKYHLKSNIIIALIYILFIVLIARFYLWIYF